MHSYNRFIRSLTCKQVDLQQNIQQNENEIIVNKQIEHLLMSSAFWEVHVGICMGFKQFYGNLFLVWCSMF